jgi:hypothetical protein
MHLPERSNKVTLPKLIDDLMVMSCWVGLGYKVMAGSNNSV